MSGHDPHDPLCGECSPHDHYCHCALIDLVRADERERIFDGIGRDTEITVRVMDAARADERERIIAELDGPARESEAMYAHAEAVAAKLVEVVCEQDDLIQIVGVDATNHRAAAADMRRERDAARAEVAALREEVAHAWAVANGEARR